MSEKYYVKVSFEYGKQTPNGNEAKNTADVFWKDMEFEEAIMLESEAVVPALNSMAEKAVELGMQLAGLNDSGKK